MPVEPLSPQSGVPGHECYLLDLGHVCDSSIATDHRSVIPLAKHMANEHYGFVTVEEIRQGVSLCRGGAHHCPNATIASRWGLTVFAA